MKNFAGQWLFLRNIARIQPDPAAFPNFDENLRQSMAKETELLVESTLREDRSVVDLLKTDYTFVNQRLAEHYGIKGIYGNEFRRVALDRPEPAGPARTSQHHDGDLLSQSDGADDPRKMGAGAAPGHAAAAAAANVPSLKDDETHKKLTMRQRMEQHRASPAMRRLPPDHGPARLRAGELRRPRQVARTRRDPGTGAIDSSGVLPDGTTFNGPAGLRDVLLSKRDLFVENFTERLLTYALGRGVEEYDRPVIRKIAREAATDDHRWSSIILGIVNSTPFQMIKQRS